MGSLLVWGSVVAKGDMEILGFHGETFNLEVHHVLITACFVCSKLLKQFFSGVDLLNFYKISTKVLNFVP